MRAAADDHQCRAVDPVADRRERTDQHVLSLTRHQSGYAHHGRPLPQPVTGAQFGAAAGIRPEGVGVDAGRQVFEHRPGPEGGRDPGPGVAADIGDDVGAVADSAQRRARPRQHRPSDFVPVGAGQHPACTGPPGGGPQQRQRRGRTEPDGLDVVVLDQSAHPALDAGYRQHQGRPVPNDVQAGRPCVVLVGTFPCRGVYREPVLAGCGQPGDQVLQIGLDAAAPWRKVVGDQQDPTHPAAQPRHCASTVSGSAPRTSRNALGTSVLQGPHTRTYSSRSAAAP